MNYFTFPPSINSFENLCFQLTLRISEKSRLLSDANQSTIGLVEQIEGQLSQKEKLNLKLNQLEKETSQKLQPDLSELPQNVAKKDSVNSQKQSKCSNQKSVSKKQQKHSYKCPYAECSRNYQSSVSMNLHIKNKHNGGSKKQRQQYAIRLLEGEYIEESKRLELPPNFLEEFTKSYEYTRKYNM